MTFIVTTDYALSQVVPPNLPLAPRDYDSRYQEQLNNVLRLYFNQLNKIVSQLKTDGTGDGSSLSFPYGAFHQNGSTTLSTGISNVSTTPISVPSTAAFPASGWILIESEVISYTGTTATTFTGITRGVLGTTNVAHTAGVSITEVQGTGSSTTIGKMLFNNTDYSNTVSVNPADQTQIVFSTAGMYNIQFSAQLLNFTTADDNVTIWNRVNGVDAIASAGIAQVPPKHGSSPGATLVSWNFLQTFAVNDYLTLAWTSETGNTLVASYPASAVAPVHPLSPGVILTATFVSAM